MDLHSLETKKFKPREGVAEASTEYAREALKNGGTEGTAKVVVTDGGDHFFFSIVAKSRNKIFSSELSFKKRDIIGWPRDWQFGAIVKLLTNFIKSIPQTKRKSDSIEAPDKENT